MPSTRVLSLKNLPILLSCTKDRARYDKKYNFELYLDRDTGVLMQKKFPPQDILYKYARNSAVGKIWENHHKAFFNFITSLDLKNKSICEIGSGRGVLAHLIGRYFPIDCYEPSPAFKGNKNIKIIKSLFNVSKKKYDVIILSHTFEHIPNASKFLKQMHRCLKPNGQIVISVPNFERGLQQKFINMLSPEHISYFTPTSLEKFLNVNGFQNCRVTKYNDHSIFICGTASKNFTSIITVDNSMLLRLLGNHQKEIKSKVYKAVVKLNKYNNKQIFLFGCTAMSSLFLYYSGLDKKRFSGVLDNDPLKNGLRLYGTQLICRQPYPISNAIVLVNGSTYHTEIVQSLKKYNYKIISWK